MNTDTVGSRIKFYRKQMGLTQSELAEECEITRNSIANYERGTSQPSDNIMRKISLVLGIKPILLNPLYDNINKSDNEVTKAIEILFKTLPQNKRVELFEKLKQTK